MRNKASRGWKAWFGVGSDEAGGRAEARSASSARVVPIHPETTTDPATLRWVVPDGLLPFAGEVERAPRLLQDLLDDGVLACVVVEPGAVLTLLTPGRTWDADGARVRSALVDALGVSRSWRGASGARAIGPDEALEAAAHDILSRGLDTYARSHGGSIRVVEVSEGVVSVELGGACEDCAAAAVTMKARFERVLRRRCPWLVEVRAVG